jgi:hypothetical protein
MLATLIIVFREVLEAALVVGIVLAATRGVPRRYRWIACGIGGGVLGAVLVAGFAGEIADAVQGMGQELFYAAILFAAVTMLGWHNIWMSRHGREMAANATRIGQEVLAGTRPLYALALVVGIAVLREGSEIVLFLYSIAASGGGASGMLVGGALGLIAGVGAGDLFRPADHSDAPPLHRHQLAHPAAGRGDGVARRRLSGPGRYRPGAGQPALGHFFPADREQSLGPGSARPHRLHRTARGHSARLLSRDPRHHRLADARVAAPADGPRVTARCPGA